MAKPQPLPLQQIHPATHAMKQSVLSRFFTRDMGVLLLLGFSSGAPLTLTGSTLQAWLTQEGVAVKTLGFFSVVGLPYSLKFLWAPLMDRVRLPFSGRRKGWILATQLSLIVLTTAIALSDPARSLMLLAILALLLCFTSASQDIAVDAYRTELLPDHSRGAGASVFIFGYRLALLVSGPLAFILVDHGFSWSTVYLCMAATFSLGLIACSLGREDEDIEPPKTLREAVVGPLFDFFARKGALEILLFVFLYKLGDVLAGVLSTTFLLQSHFTLTEIGSINKAFGLIATISGTFIGAALLMRFGMRTCLVLFGILQAASTLLFTLVAFYPGNISYLIPTVAAENLAAGMGTAALAAFMMQLCNKRFTATQYALLTSFTALPRTLLGATTGYLQMQLGWPLFFVLCTALALPGIILPMVRFHSWSE